MNTWLTITIVLTSIFGMENLIAGITEYKKKHKPLAFLEFIIASLCFTLLVIALFYMYG